MIIQIVIPSNIVYVSFKRKSSRSIQIVNIQSYRDCLETSQWKFIYSIQFECFRQSRRRTHLAGWDRIEEITCAKRNWYLNYYSNSNRWILSWKIIGNMLFFSEREWGFWILKFKICVEKRNGSMLRKNWGWQRKCIINMTYTFFRCWIDLILFSQKKKFTSVKIKIYSKAKKFSLII